jgi:hypothetical protein
MSAKLRTLAGIFAILAWPVGCDDGNGSAEDSTVDTLEDTLPDTEQDILDVDQDTQLDATDTQEEPVTDGPGLPDFEWDAPVLPDRYGFFQVQQVSSATGDISFAGGDFGDYSAVEPARPVWADGTCTVVFYDPDPPDAEGFARLSAGSPVTITGGGGSHGTITCTHDAGAGYVCDIPATAGNTIFADGGGEMLSFDAPGDDVQAFTFDVLAPVPVVRTSPLVISKGAGYTVSWDEIDTEGVVIALVVGDYAASLSGGISIQCIVDLSGDPAPTSFEIPDVALSLLDNTGMVGGSFYVGLLQVMALTTHNDTLVDGTVIEVMVMNGAASQVTVTD